MSDLPPETEIDFIIKPCEQNNLEETKKQVQKEFEKLIDRDLPKTKIKQIEYKGTPHRKYELEK